MSQAEIFSLVQQVQDQYGSLFAQLITINFAMIVAIWYFLHRTQFRFRIATFVFFLVGMLTLVGLMLQQANIKGLARRALEQNRPDLRSSVVAYMLFHWRHPDNIQGRKTNLTETEG